MVDFELNRREFLEASAGLACFPYTRLSRGFTPMQRCALLALVRTLFPREGVDESVYLKVVAAIERRCVADPVILSTLAPGIAALERKCQGGLANVHERTRLALLLRTEKTRFYRVLYSETLEGLFGSLDTWAMFISAGRQAGAR